MAHKTPKERPPESQLDKARELAGEQRIPLSKAEERVLGALEQGRGLAERPGDPLAHAELKVLKRARSREK